MTILILAAGISKRMWPLQSDKLLLPFLGKPFFYHTLKALKDAKNDINIVVVANPNNKEGLASVASELGVNTQFVVQEEASGMHGAILAAGDLLTGSVIIMNGDDLLEPSLYAQILSSVEQNSSDIHLVAKVFQTYFPGGYVKVEGEKVKEIIEKPGAGNEPSDMVKLVFDYFKDAKKLVETLKNTTSDKDDIYENALDTLINQGAVATVSRYEGDWGALKYPWHILHVTELLLKRLQPSISPKAQISKTSVIQGNVVIEDDVKVFENAIIKGPSYIGNGTIIGDNALIRNSILEEKVVAGYGTEIARSYVGDNSWFHTNYIGDSVIEGDFGMGSGAITANVRLDGKTIRTLDNTIDTGLSKLGVIAGRGVRMGVNSTTMPGVCVGRNSLIGPQVIANKNVSENQRIILKQDLEISENKEILSYDKFREGK